MKNRAKKFATTIWSVEDPSKKQIQNYVRVSPDDDGAVKLVFFKDGSVPFPTYSVVTLTRNKARLLARRINQMLEETA
jgi:hypothetical protein